MDPSINRLGTVLLPVEKIVLLQLWRFMIYHLCEWPSGSQFNVYERLSIHYTISL